MGQVLLSTVVGCGTFSGWTCPNCGVWVPAGQTHICPNCPQTTGIYCYSCGLPAKIDMLLEKLAKLIELLEREKK